MSVPASGDLGSRYAVVGECPGAEELEQGLGFVGPSGDVLWTLMLHFAYIHRDECWVDNLSHEPFVKFEKVDGTELERLRTELLCRLATLDNLEYVLTVGRWASRALIGDWNLRMEEIHGKHFTSTLWGGGGRQRYWIIVPCYHPAAALRGDPDALAKIGRDVASLREGPYYQTNYEIPKYRTACDTEGTLTDPWCLTLADSTGTTLTGESESFCRIGAVILHPALHDIPVARKLGWELECLADTTILAHAEGGYLGSLSKRDDGNGAEAVSSAQELKSVARYLDFPEPLVDFDTAIMGARLKVAQEILDFGGLNPRQEKKYKRIIERKDPSAIAKLIPRVTKDQALADPTFTEYAKRDPRTMLHLYSKLKPNEDLPWVHTSHALIPMLIRMQEVGMQLDPDAVYALKGDLDVRIAEEREEIGLHATWGCDLPDFNPDKPAELSALLEREGIQTKTTKTGKQSTGKMYLKRVAQGEGDVATLVRSIAEYRSLGAIEDKVDDLVERVERGELVVHPRWRQTRIPTGRLACFDPNLMAFPARTEIGNRVRGCFVARPGHLLGAWDLSQIEIRFLAHNSGDETLCKAYCEGKDIHQDISEFFGISRAAAKTANFALQYEGKPKKIMEAVEASGADLVKLTGAIERKKQLGWFYRFVDRWYERYSGVRAYQERVHAEIKRTGMARVPLTGRPRLLPLAVCDRSEHFQVRDKAFEALRQGFNHENQGDAQAYEQECMVTVWTDVIPAVQACGWYCEPLLQIHDELLLEIDEDAWDVTNTLMLDALEDRTLTRFRVPITAGSGRGKRWSELK